MPGYDLAEAMPSGRSASARNAATTRGSNWAPAHRSSSSIATSSLIAPR